MNAERLLAHYETIADAPDAIARLRRFILDLAVRGKLVPQDAGDEPASELLKRIAKEKAGAGRREKAEVEIDNEGKIGALPPTWRIVPLIALGSWAIGSGFPKNEQGLETGPYFFLKVSDMNLPGNEKYITTSNNFIDDTAARRMRAKIHPPGTIIFPKIGGAIATNKRRILTHGSAIDNNCLGITFASELNVEWAFLLLTTLDFTRYQAGTAVPALQQGVLERIPVGLPPLAEQHRIVAKVDELMALCDRLEAARAAREAVRDRLAAASLARLNAPDPETFQADARFVLDALPALTARPDQIKQLRQTILNLAVRGKLVPQDPNDEPASELLKRIAKEKARLVKAGEIRKPPTLEPITDAEALYALPRTWAWVRVGDIFDYDAGTKRDPKELDQSRWLLELEDIEKDTSRIVERLRVSDRDSQSTKSEFEPGDILYGKLRPYLNKVVVADEPGYSTTEIVAIRAFLRLCPEYCALAFRRPDFVAYVERLGRGTKMPRLRTPDAIIAPFPLPPLAEQYRIVAKVDELMALCDRLEASLAATSATRRLLDALLAEALAPVDARELEAAE